LRSMDQKTEILSETYRLFNTVESWQEELNKVRSAFESQFRGVGLKDTPIPWVRDVFDTYVIVEDGGKLYRVPYKKGQAGFEFSPESEWVEVTMTYVPKV
jgi:hypothetical protein